MRVFECAWLCPFKTELSAIRSLPGCFCVCEAEEKKELDAERHRDPSERGCRCTAKAAIKRINNQNIEKDKPITEALRPSGGSHFMVVSRGSDRD